MLLYKYMLKVNNTKTRTRCKKFSKLAWKTSKRRHWLRSGVFIVNFEDVSLPIFVSLLFTLNRYIFAENLCHGTLKEDYSISVLLLWWTLNIDILLVFLLLILNRGVSSEVTYLEKNVRWGKSLGGNGPGGNLMKGQFPGGNYAGGKYNYLEVTVSREESGGLLSRENFIGSNCSEGNYPKKIIRSNCPGVNVLG